MPITTYEELKTALPAWLDNTNPTVVATVPDAIGMAHSRLTRVLRVWEMETRLSLPLTPVDVLEEDLGYYDLPEDWAGHKSVVRRADTLLVVYLSRIPELSDSVPTNWLLAKHPDVYLYGSLMELAGFAKSAEEIQRWSQAYTTTIEEIINQDWNDSLPRPVLRQRRKVEGLKSYGTLIGDVEYVTPEEYDDIETTGVPSVEYSAGVFTVSAGQIRIWPKPAMPEP
jgi:hypothetical protein